MATANTSLIVTELDYGSIRTNLTDFFRSQSEWNDYDFEGSGLSVLLSNLAYNTHYLGLNLHLVTNEMFLDSALLRGSVVSHAKLTNYVPRSKVGATAKVNIRVTPAGSEDTTATELTMDRYTRFLSNPLNGTAYNFVTLNSVSATKANGSFLFSNVAIRQGEVAVQNFLVDGINKKYVIDTDSLDASTLRVSVQESVANTTQATYIPANDITQIDSTSQIYFLEENSIANGKYSIYFGDSILGKNLSNGNIVIANYLITRGPEANKANKFTAVAGVGGYTSNVIVTTTQVAAGGAEKETIENIKYRAPIHYTAQNRAVIETDYEILLLKDYPNIEAVNVWGGADNLPPVYGKVFIAIKPVEDYFITPSEKERIKNEIIANRSVLTVFPEIVDPIYTFLLVRVNAYYNPSATTYDENEIKEVIKQAILDYKDEELKQFNSVFRKSKLTRRIDLCHPAITSSEIEVFLQKRVEPELNVNQNINFNFNTELYKAGSINKLFSFPEILVQDGSGVQRRVLIEEVPDSFTGVDRIIVTNPGQDYTQSPTVTIAGDGSGATAEAIIVNGKINSINVLNRGSNFSRALVSITGGGGTGGAAIAELQARNGTLRTYYFHEVTGEKVIVNPSAGTIDYDSGEVIVTSIEPQGIIENPIYNNTLLTMSVQPEKDVVYSERNSILDIDENDSSAISIQVIPE